MGKGEGAQHSRGLKDSHYHKAIRGGRRHEFFKVFMASGNDTARRSSVNLQ